MNNPVISVITPTYNSAEYINRFIDNFNKANQKGIAELILVDDGSRDNTITLIKQRISPNDQIKLLTQDHQFQSAARNLGMKYASGDYYLFLDADDTFDPEFFNILLNNSENNDLVICGINRVLQDNTLVLNKSVLEGYQSKNKIAKRFLIDRDQMDSGLWNKLFKANIIKENNLSFTNKNFVEDILFVFKYLMTINPSKIKFIHKPLYVYYQNSGTTTTTYYPELDSLAKSYIDQVRKCLIKNHIKNENLLTINTAIRTEIYVIHRHILGDNRWNALKQKAFIKSLKTQFTNTQFLPFKYKVGLLTMQYLPATYIKIYQLYKRVH